MRANKTRAFNNIDRYSPRCKQRGFVLLIITLLSPAILLLSSTRVNAEKFASIIIDDLGNSYQHGYDIIKLPGAITLAILPRTNYAKDLARLAIENHKEVMLHLPMQSVENQKPSPGTLDLHMTRKEFTRQLRLNLNSVPYVRGVNNHMGSLLTRHPGHMRWLMDELSHHGRLYFVDSKTTGKSIAGRIAIEHQIPNFTRDIFLDPDYDEKTIKQQFDLFIKKVNQSGYALAIAHPHPKTIKFLQTHLEKLTEQGITLIPVSQLIQKTSSYDRSLNSQQTGLRKSNPTQFNKL